MTALAWIVSGLAAWPMLVVATECFAGLRAASPTTDPLPPAVPAALVPPFAVLVPAHDEALGIAATIAAVTIQLRPCDRLLVIADNCRDATATIAAEAGAAVAQRWAPDLVGKAYALAFGRDILDSEPPAIVVMLDADCLPAPGALALLAGSAARHDAAMQGRYLLDLGPDTKGAASPIVRISGFAFLVRNMIRQRGLQRLAGTALLQGSGMAMPWRLFRAAPLITSSLVEDLKLGLDLALAGHRIGFEDAAHFHGRTSSTAATATQRTRWEQGMLTTAATYVPRLLRAGMRRPALLLLAIDIAVPPLALLIAMAGVVTMLLTLVVLLGGSPAPLALLIVAQAVFAAAMWRTWSRFGRTILPLRDLRRVPLYILWKQPIYLRLVAHRERRWVRTSRIP